MVVGIDAHTTLVADIGMIIGDFAYSIGALSVDHTPFMNRL